MNFVKITKDGIAGVAVVPETALPYYQADGWRLVDVDAPTTTAPEPSTRVRSTPLSNAQRRTNVATESTEE